MEKLYQRLEELTQYAIKVLPLANSHVVNFITHSLWDVYLPRSIHNELVDRNLNEVFDAIWHHWKFGTTTNGLYNLGEFLGEAARMSIGTHDGITLSMKDLEKKLASWGCGDCDGLKFDQFMPQKKMHEVEIMSFLVANMASLTGSSHVVDIGGGKGYLGSLLALEYNLKVLGLDSCRAKTSGVARRAKKLEKVWRRARKKKLNMANINLEEEGNDEAEVSNFNENLGEYKQLTEFVSDVTDITGMINRTFPCGKKSDKIKGMGLIGLHTCGTLAPVCLRQFVKDAETTDYLVNVGCCYNLMEEINFGDSNPGVMNGFPMSRYLRRRKFTIGRNARMLALQAKPRMSSVETFSSESLMYRALLQQLLLEKISAEKIPKVGRIADKCSSFQEYVHKAMEKLNLSIELTDDEVLDVFNKYKSWELKLKIFFMLRVSLAPVFENIILLDRLLYLKEQGIHHSYLVKMFDPVISPRCYGILALRDRTHSMLI